MTNNQISNHRSKLEHFWLDGEAGKLHPAEQKLLECVAKGDVCEIASERPVAATRENTIRSSFLRFLILGGDESAPVHERGVDLEGAFVDCGCSKGRLDFQGTTINNDIFLDNCEIDGDIDFLGCKTKTVSMQGSKVKSFYGDGMNASGDVYLRNGFHAGGTVRLLGVKIAGNLECDNSEFAAVGYALHCDGMEVDGDVFLRNGFHASGLVRVPGAKIGGQLDCRNGYFAKHDVSIIAQNIQISGNLFLGSGFQASGEVDFRNARIGGNVYCSDAIFSCKNQSLVFNRAVIDGMVLLGKGLMSAGQVSFAGAKIGRDFSAQGVSLEGNPSLQLRNAEIRGTLTWRGIKYAHGQLDFTGVSCRDFSFDEQSWKKPKEIKLTGFAYKSFTELPSNADANFWREWLGQQPKSHLQTKFRPKPYEYLADVLSSMGYEEESRSIRVEKQRMQTEFISKYQPLPRRYSEKVFRRLNGFWRRRILGPSIDYGYRPGKAAMAFFFIALIGMIIYSNAAQHGVMSPANPLIYKEAHVKGGLISSECKKNWVYPSKNCKMTMPSEHSEFQAFIYSADVLLPLVDLRQEVDWAPSVVHPDGSFWLLGHAVRVWEWFEIVAGWVLSLLFVSAIGGIIKR